MFNNIYVVKDKISGLMTSQLMVASNDLVAIKGFADSLKNVADDLKLDTQLYRIGSISENGQIQPTSISGIFPPDVEKYSATMVCICDSTNFNEKFEDLIQKHNEAYDQED